MKYITGEVRSVRTDDGFDFIAETTDDKKAAADFPRYWDARGFQLRLALDGYRIESVEESENAVCHG